MLLNRENITNAAVMIQPSLISYSFNSLPAPALLDVASISVDRILLLDSYFSVVIFHGMTIAQWRNMGYQNQPEHQVYVFIITIQTPSLFPQVKFGPLLDLCFTAYNDVPLNYVPDRHMKVLGHLVTG